MGKERSLFTSGMSNVIAIIISVIIGINLTPLIIKNIGEIAFGQYSLSLSLLGYALALASVLDSSIVVLISKLKNNESFESIARVVSSSYGYYLIVAFIALVFSLLFASTSSSLLGSGQDSFHKEFLLMSIACLFNILTMFYVSLVTSRESFISLNVINTISLVLRFAVILLAFRFSPTFKFLALGEIVSSTIKLFLLTVFKGSKYKNTVGLHFIEKETFLLIFQTVKKSMIVFIATILKGQLNSLVIAKYISIAMVGQYTIAITFMSYISSLVMGAFNVLSPRFSKLVGNNETKQIQSYLYNAITLSSIVSYGFVVMVYFFGNRMVEFWVGSSYRMSFEFILIILVGFSLSTAQYPVISLFYSKDKQHVFGYLAFIEGAFCFVLSLLLVDNMGAHGVVWALSGPLFISKLVIQPVLASKYLGLKYLQYVGSFIYPLVLLVPFGLMKIKYELTYTDCLRLSISEYIFNFILCASLYLALSGIYLYFYTRKEKLNEI